MLAGERIAILASEQRMCTAVDLISKLNLLRVSRGIEPIRWKKNGGSAGTGTQLVGFCCTRDQSSRWRRPPNIPVYFDLNNHRLFCQIYEGRLLAALNSAKNFSSDHALILYTVAVVSEIGLIARVARRIPIELLSVRLRLSDEDLLIVSNILAEYDLIRYLNKRNIVKKALSKPYRNVRLWH